ncbi:hypothetical protein HPB52_001067 [Rhipicephalus sanguineus]|uniref:Uncharacterized protein n=1 Tax=Rhipicephalus sanguineus TaxID=34632 RepID=A0A9D4PTI7_RHISA|nr:hypothetical protein HPB52_001067 [Rhipicephalus sanguineus]
MLPRPFPPMKPFNPGYSRAWFTHLDAILALNVVTAHPVMHAVLLNALPVELPLTAASTSSPQPFDDLCAAVPACYGETYHPPLCSRREFPASVQSQRAVPIGLQPSLDQDLTPPTTSRSTSRPTTAASPPALDDQDEVEHVPPSLDQFHTLHQACPPSACLPRP